MHKVFEMFLAHISGVLGLTFDQKLFIMEEHSWMGFSICYGNPDFPLIYY